MGGGAAVAAMAAAKIKQITRTFKDAGATSMHQAKTLADLKLDDSRMFRNLVDNGSIKTASPGTFYFDEPYFEEMMRRRRTLVLVIALVVAIAAVAFGYLKSNP